MKLETWVKILVFVLVVNGVFTIMNYFKSPPPPDITPADIQYLLKTQEQKLIRKTNSNIRDEAFKVMDNVHTLLADTSKYDSLWTVGFGL